MASEYRLIKFFEIFRKGCFQGDFFFGIFNIAKIFIQFFFNLFFLLLSYAGSKNLL